MRKFLGFTTILFFLFVMLFGLNLSMKTLGDGSMSDCPFAMGQSSMCQMPASDHLSKWQQTFTATLQFAYYPFFLTVFVFIFRSLIYQFTLAPPRTVAFYRYRLNHPDTKLFNFLLQAFSDGIIQPKISL